MSPLPSPLPLFDRTLLRAIEQLVPLAEREEWSRAWHAELWHMHHPAAGRAAHISSLSKSCLSKPDRAIGLLSDALWLRTDSWKHIFGGTATLCLASLLSLTFLSALLALILNGSWHILAHSLRSPFQRFLVAVPLVVFVSFATASRRHTEKISAGKLLYRLRRQLFFAAKTGLVLLLAFLVSVDLCQPIHAPLPNTADIAQIFFLILLAIVGLRWAFNDQDQRCKQCLRALAMPSRVGRPSHNLLEWNGTELACKQGHGLLSVPEMETSWCQSSQWIYQNPCWD